MQKQSHWDLIIRPKVKWYDIDLKGVWHYRDLVMLFVKRDFVSQYKQTILGPLWLFIQPLLTVLVFSVIFGIVANIPTGGAPRLLFYLAAFVPWSYFAECFSKNSNTFTGNASIFGKVYFPRLVRPVSIIISNLYKFMVQMILLVLVYLYFSANGFDGSPNWYILFFPLLVLLIAGYGFSLGLIVSSLTTKYRDLTFITGVLTQLLMYGSSIVYSISDLPPKYAAYLKWNPLAWIMEASRYALLGIGTWSWHGLAYATGIMIVLVFIAVVIFNRIEKSFMDTV